MRKLEGTLTYEYRFKNLTKGWYLQIIFSKTLATLIQVGVRFSNDTEM